MNFQYDAFIDDYLNLSPDDFTSKYGKEGAEIPELEQLLEHLHENKKMHLLINKSGECDDHKGVVLVDHGLGKKYEVYTPFRGQKTFEEYFISLEEAVREKMRRSIGGLWGFRR